MDEYEKLPYRVYEFPPGPVSPKFQAFAIGLTVATLASIFFMFFIPVWIVEAGFTAAALVGAVLSFWLWRRGQCNAAEVCNAVLFAALILFAVLPHFFDEVHQGKSLFNQERVPRSHSSTTRAGR